MRLRKVWYWGALRDIKTPGSSRESRFFYNFWHHMMIRSSDRAMNEAMLLTALIFLSVLYAADADNVIFKKSHQRMQKLCSRKLSDALQVMCRDRGYNEPFYSNEDESRIDPGPGLVEECCYHQCTYEQMEQYCKPLPAEKRIDSRDDVMWVDVSAFFYVLIICLSLFFLSVCIKRG